MTKKTKVTLLSWTQNPLETIYAEWIQSRTIDPVPDPNMLAKERMFANLHGDRPHPMQVKILEVFEKVIAMKMPLGESINFVFLLEHCPVALREQLVRHRIGHKFGEKIGADIIPDLAGTSSFWSQTTRIIDMGSFATDGEYLEPVWLEENGEKEIEGYAKREGEDGECTTVREFYHQQMRWIQAAYRRLVKAGMPMEDARNVLPVAMQHRMTWTTNLSALMHVLSRRGCWLAQLGMWEPVIHGIIEELATKIHSTFRRLIDPPCFDGNGDWSGCVFKKENEEVINNGNYPPCSLWVNKEYEASVRERNSGSLEWKAVSQNQMPRYRRMQERYAQLWKRDPRTGERVQIT